MSYVNKAVILFVGKETTFKSNGAQREMCVCCYGFLLVDGKPQWWVMTVSVSLCRKGAWSDIMCPWNCNHQWLIKSFSLL